MMRGWPPRAAKESSIKLSLKGLVVAGAVIWGGALLIVGMGNLIWEGYGQSFLEMAASIYPGYSVDGDLGQVLVGTLYGAFDGALAAAVFGLVYNRFASSVVAG